MLRRFTIALSLVLATAALAAQQAPSSGNSATWPRLDPLGLVLTTGALAEQQATQPPVSQSASDRPDPQVPPITFRSQVDVVEVDAVVRDSQGNFVRDLKPEEFRVFEDGAPQTVTAFSLIDIPVLQADRPLFVAHEIEPDVHSNTDAPVGRVYVLLLDDLHTAFERSTRVRMLAKQFIERNLGANDLAAVIHTSGRTQGQDFTNSRRLLEAAVDRFVGRKLRSAFLNKLDIYTKNNALGNTETLADSDQNERLYQARNLLNTIQNLSDWLAGVHGRRKAMILVGEGIDYGIVGPGDASSDLNSTTSTTSSGSDTSAPSSSTSIMKAADNRGEGLALAADSKDAIAAAVRANVNIYAVDPRGLAVADEDLITVSGAPPNDPTLGLSSTDLANELRRGQDSLRALSEETGGFASVASNDFGTALRRIVEENSSYYMLGYHPANPKRDGRTRRIEVRLTRPGLRVKARRSYTSPSDKPVKEKAAKIGASAGTSKELQEALDSPLPTADFRFAVFAAPFKGTGNKAAIAVVSQFDAHDITFTQAGAVRTNVLELSCVAVDAQGKVAGGSRERVDLTLKPETYQRVLQSGFRMQSRLELAPGTYQLRVGAREAGGRLGSVYYTLVVPDFSDKSLAMSGLVLTSKTAAMVPTAGAIPELASALPTPPTTARAFHPSDELSVLAEVYDNDAKHPHSVDIMTTLVAEGRLPVFSTTESRSSQELAGAKGGYGHVAKIPLANLAPGLYVLRVEAKSSLRGVTGVAREVQLRIE